MSSSSDTTPAFSVTKNTKVTLPAALIVTLLVAVAVGYARWYSTAERVDRHDGQIKDLEQDARSTQATLIRIEERAKAIDDKLNDLRSSSRRSSP